MWLAWGISLLFLLATTVLLAKDLDRPARFLYVLLRPQWKSWLVLGGYTLTVYGLILTIWGVATALEWPTIVLVAGWLATALAIITAVYTAFLFAQAKGRDFWQTPTLALHMLLHALLAGGAVFAVLFLYSPPIAGWAGFLQNGLMLTVGLNLLVILFEMITPHPTADARRTVDLIVRGRFENYFWIGVVMIGNVVPFTLAWAGGPLMLAGAGVCILVGMYITEYIWVRAPQEIPLS
jgi:formate-dependent nitrite reductase membrane component NrfD